MRGKTKAQRITHMAALTAITLLLAATPLGYIPLNPLVTITIIVTPVTVGGLVYGWPAGLLLGLVFGLTSFARAPGEALGQLMLSRSIALTLFACVVPRQVVGLSGAGAHALARKYGKLRSMWFYTLAGVAGSLLNTLCFLGAVAVLFDSAETGITGAVIWGIVSFNGVIEAAVNGALVGIVGRALMRRPKNG